MTLHRRQFLRHITTAVAGFIIVPRHVLGRGYLAPSDQLTRGVVGMGEAGRVFPYTGTRVTAVCDVDSRQLANMDKGVFLTDDYRELLLRPDIDIIHIATPPHWHGIIATEAAAAGKDIWCETPMTLTIGEGQRVAAAVQSYGRIFGLNMNGRYNSQLKKLAASDLLGWPLKVT